MDDYKTQQNDYKKTIDKQSTQNEMLIIENRNLEIENTKLKAREEMMSGGSYNNNSHNYSHI